LSETAQGLAGSLGVLASLVLARRFAGLFWCQFLSVFNDHYVRNMLAMLILFRLDAAERGDLITLAIGTFIAPSLFLSGLGGDAHDKAWLARRLKFAEILVQLVAALGLVFSSLFLLYAALFGLGVISALFGPVKYGILPDLLPKEELLDALVEAATFIAIFLGLIAGGLSVAGRTPEGTVFQLLANRLCVFRREPFYSPGRARRCWPPGECQCP
jgi:MFS family permease